MPPSVAGSASAAAERTAAKLEAIRNKMPTANRAVKVEAKYDVVLDYPNLELHSAAANGNVGLVHYALTHGQPVNSLLHGCVPLHAASSGGNVTVVRMLIERGADVNAPRLPRRYSDKGKTSNMPSVGTTGSTPLHFAAANGHAAVVQLLLACGAIVDKQDKNGLTSEDLAEMSGHTGVVHTIRVWRQMNEAQSPTTTGSDGGDREAGPSRRTRRDSVTSSQWTGSDTGESPQTVPNHAGPAAIAATAITSSARKTKERTQSMVSTASEKSISRLRSSFENVRGGVRIQPIKTAFAKQQAHQPPAPPPPPSQPPSTPQQQPAEPRTPQLVVTTSTPPQQDSVTETPIFGSPTESLLSGDPDTNQFNLVRTLSPVSVDSVDSEQVGYPQRSSRRPSLPSIIEKAGHPRSALRASIQKANEYDSSASITESPPTSPLLAPTPSTGTSIGGGSGSSFFRGRGRNMDRRINKQAILGLFRHGMSGMSPHSRSPSPPRKTEPTQPIDVDKVDANVARLKRASMDPELLRMAMDAAQLREQLEANATTSTTSAPVTKTRFFEDFSTRNSSTQSLSSGPVPFERPWERRKGSGVISPSPLAREWSGVDDEPVVPSRVEIRRTRTEVRRVSPSTGYPRRMPSEPHMAAAVLARRRSMGSGYGSRAVSDPASISSTPIDSPFPAPSDAEAADDEREDIITSAMPSIQALAASQADETTPEESPEDTPAETEEEETSLHEAVPSAADVPALTLDAPDGDSELTSSAELKPYEAPADTGRFRGESIGSATTESYGLRTPPSAQVTPPGHVATRRSSTESDGPIMTSPPSKNRPSRSRGHSEVSMASILEAGFPPVPEHEPACAPDRPRPPAPVRKISSHAEARDRMEQTERDVLELAQMPVTEDSCRSLADQLAAYGETHAIAEEFARAERLSSLSSGSERNSVASSDSARKRPSSYNTNRHSRLGMSPPLYGGSVPGIDQIYERRDQAYRDRMAALTSSTPIYGMRSTVARSRSISGDANARTRASTTSDNWLNAGPNPAFSQRRLTEPASTIEKPESNPHISGPIPMVSDPLGIRPSQKGRPRSLANRPQLPSSLKGLTPAAPLRPAALSINGVVSGNPRSTPVGGLGRSVSLHRPNDKVNSVRYQGLAHARNFSASASVSASGTGSSLLAPPRDARSHARRSSDMTDRDRKELAKKTNSPPDWHTGYMFDTTSGGLGLGVGGSSMPMSVPVAEKTGRWGQFKGAIGNLRR